MLTILIHTCQECIDLMCNIVRTWVCVGVVVMPLLNMQTAEATLDTAQKQLMQDTAAMMARAQREGLRTGCQEL